MQKNSKVVKSKIIRNEFWFYARAWFESSKEMDIRSKIKSVCIALFLGLLLSFGIMCFFTLSNPFVIIKGMTIAAFGSTTFDYTLSLIALLLVAGIANAIAFKAGLFNIGVSGQMFISGALMVILGLTILNNLGPMGLVILIWIGAIIGAIIASFVGFLKVKCGVHEVVSTILLNWGLFYFTRFIINLVGPTVISPSGATKPLPPSFQLSQSHYGLILLVFGLIIAIVFYFLLQKTTLGYSVRAMGLSEAAARYAGIKIKRQTVVIMVLSGLVAGLLGVMTFVIQERQVGSQYLVLTQLPKIGFEGIAIALLGFSNPLGIILVATVLGIIQGGASGLSTYGIDKSFSNLILGIVMYFAAISILFIRFKPIQMIYTWIKINKRGFPVEYKQMKESYQVVRAKYAKFSADKSLKEKKIAYSNINRVFKLNKKLFRRKKVQEWYWKTHFYGLLTEGDNFRTLFYKTKKKKADLRSQRHKCTWMQYRKQKRIVKKEFIHELISLQNDERTKKRNL